jgi:hypothetical protein
LTICGLCREEAEDLTKCKKCGQMFCEYCGDIDIKTCWDCSEEDDENGDSDDDDWEEDYVE